MRTTRWGGFLCCHARSVAASLCAPEATRSTESSTSSTRPCCRASLAANSTVEYIRRRIPTSPNPRMTPEDLFIKSSHMGGLIERRAAETRKHGHYSRSRPWSGTADAHCWPGHPALPDGASAARSGGSRSTNRVRTPKYFFMTWPFGRQRTVDDLERRHSAKLPFLPVRTSAGLAG
jgi:hypothetical protein